MPARSWSYSSRPWASGVSHTRANSAPSSICRAWNAAYSGNFTLSSVGLRCPDPPKPDSRSRMYVEKPTRGTSPSFTTSIPASSCASTVRARTAAVSSRSACSSWGFPWSRATSSAVSSGVRGRDPVCVVRMRSVEFCSGTSATVPRRTHTSHDFLNL